MEKKKQNKIKLSRLRLQKCSKSVNNSNSDPVSSQISKYFNREACAIKSEPINTNLDSPNVSSCQTINSRSCISKEDTDNLLLEEYNKIKSNSKNDFENSISDFLVPAKAKLKNYAFSPMMTRSKRKDPPKATQKKKPGPKPKFDRKQPKIKKAISVKTDIEKDFSDRLNEQCMAEDINPEHLQMAIALSKSMITEPDDFKNDTTTYFPDTQERLALIKTTLEQFGFKNSKTINNEKIAVVEKSKIQRIRANCVLLNRTPECRAKLVEQKTAELLNESDFESNIEPVIQIYKIHSTILKEYYKGSTIFYLNKLNRNELSERKTFYTNLMSPSDVEIGFLLKDWADIPGRDKSPERIKYVPKNINQERTEGDINGFSENRTITEILNIEEKSLDSTSIQYGTSFAKAAKKRSPRKLAKAKKLGLSLIRSHSENYFERVGEKSNVMNKVASNSSLSSNELANFQYYELSTNNDIVDFCDESTKIKFGKNVSNEIETIIIPTPEKSHDCNFSTYLTANSPAKMIHSSFKNVGDDSNLDEISSNKTTQQFLAPMSIPARRCISPDIFGESFESDYNLNTSDYSSCRNVVPRPTDIEACDLMHVETEQDTSTKQTEICDVLDLTKENIIPSPPSNQMCKLTRKANEYGSDKDSELCEVILDLTQSSESDVCDKDSEMTPPKKKPSKYENNTELTNLNISTESNQINFEIFHKYSSDEDVFETSNGICHFESFSKSTTPSDASFNCSNNYLQISKNSCVKPKMNLHNETTLKSNNESLTITQMEKIILLSNNTVSPEKTTTTEDIQQLENLLYSPITENPQNNFISNEENIIDKPKNRKYCRNIFRNKILTDSLYNSKRDSLHEAECLPSENNLLFPNYSPIFNDPDNINKSLTINETRLSAKSKKSFFKSTKSFDSTFDCEKRNKLYRNNSECNDHFSNKSKCNFLRQKSLLKDLINSSDEEFDLNLNGSKEKSLSTSSDSLLVISDEELSYSVSTPYKKPYNTFDNVFKDEILTTSNTNDINLSIENNQEKETISKENIYEISSDSEDEKMQLEKSINKKTDWDYTWSTDDESNDVTICDLNKELKISDGTPILTTKGIVPSSKYHQISTDLDDSTECSVYSNLFDAKDNRDIHSMSTDSESELETGINDDINITKTNSDAYNTPKKTHIDNDVISTSGRKENGNTATINDNNLSSYDEMIQYFPAESDDDLVLNKSNSASIHLDKPLNPKNSFQICSPLQDSIGMINLTRIGNDNEMQSCSIRKPKPRRVTELQEIKTPITNLSLMDETLKNVAEINDAEYCSDPNKREDPGFNYNFFPHGVHGRTKTLSNGLNDTQLNDLCRDICVNFKTSSPSLQQNETFSRIASRSSAEDVETLRTEAVYTPRNSKDFQTLEDGQYMYRTKNVTPKPDYDRMDTPQRLKELHKYGLKPLKRARANKILEYIYNQTHPLAEIKSDDMEIPSKKRKISNHKIDNIRINSAKHNINVAEDLTISNNIDTSGNSLLQNGFNGVKKDEDFILPTKWTKGKISSCMVPLHLSFFNLVSSKPDLREAILRYEPIDLDDLHAQLKDLGYRYDSKDLISFLDKRCITVKTKDRTRKEKPIKTSQSNTQKSRKKHSKQAAMCLETVDLDLEFAGTQNTILESQALRNKIFNTQFSLDLNKKKSHQKSLRKVKSVELCFKPISDSSESE